MEKEKDGEGRGRRKEGWVPGDGTHDHAGSRNKAPRGCVRVRPGRRRFDLGSERMNLVCERSIVTRERVELRVERVELRVELVAPLVFLTLELLVEHVRVERRHAQPVEVEEVLRLVVSSRALGSAVGNKLTDSLGKSFMDLYL